MTAAVGGGFQLDELLADCGDVTNDSKNLNEDSQQPQHAALDTDGAATTPAAESSDDGDDLYADLQQPAGVCMCTQPCKSIACHMPKLHVSAQPAHVFFCRCRSG